jgi:hypothetical protein
MFERAMPGRIEGGTEERRKKELKMKKLKEVISKNHVTMEEIKEISTVMNHGEQCVMDNEEHLCVSQVIPMNVHQSKEVKRKRKLQKRYQKRRQKKELYSVIRLYFKEPFYRIQRCRSF